MERLSGCSGEPLREAAVSTTEFETVTRAVTAYLQAAGIDDLDARRRLCARIIRSARNAASTDASRQLVELALREARRVVTSYLVPTRRFVETATPVTVPTKMPAQQFTYRGPFGMSGRLRESLRALAAEQARPVPGDARKA